MIPKLLPLTQGQLALLERLAGQGEAHPPKIVLTDDLPIELLIGSTVLVANGFIELPIDNAGATAYSITERGRQIRTAGGAG